ncbi:nibrin isoform X1 [Embiotoca jacksoni]|uniref:nibrin isoform X1 n=1 Tax=Embiotoca jacksoni TaxID=100190 RepID=UPI003703F0D6
MWILTALQPGGETHYLVPGNEYVVGRKNCEILLPSDQSISRVHAHLTATDQALTLKDTSKYGTFVNNQRLTTPVNLKSEDDITFGVFQSKFSVCHQKPVVCSSCLDNNGKVSLSQALLALGGKLVNTWTQDCTHLAMPSVKVTIKTISALLCCRPIVKPEFFSELNAAVQQKTPLPKAESFIPEIDEPSLSKEDVKIGTIPGRKQLFTGKTFIFLSAKQLKRLSAAVSFGGGSSQLLEEGSLPRDLLESQLSCVIDATAGASQTLLPGSTTEWANSVKSIVQRKGLRVVTESEIGLAAIYASCDKYCNPSSVTPDSESAPKVKTRIPSASLSQNMAVNETVLPAASQNMTAYAVNTESTQGVEMCEATGVAAVGEIPEKKQNQNTSQLPGSKLTAHKTTNHCIVAETMSLSPDTIEIRDPQRKKPDSKVTVSCGSSTNVRPQLAAPKTSGGTKTSFYKSSPQKPKISPQTSPRKQSTLINFFQPVTKKRPLEDELSAVMSEPKRPVREASVTKQAPNIPATSKEISSLSFRGPAAVSQTALGSAADLFMGRSEAISEEQRSRKRKAMEEEIQVEELESIMSEDMDCFDEQLSSDRKSKVHSSAKQKQDLDAEETSSSSKRQRAGNGVTKQRPQLGLKEEPSSHKNQSQQSELPVVSIKTEQVHPTQYMPTNHESSKPPEVSFASTSKTITPFEEDDASFIEVKTEVLPTDIELLSMDICQPKEETKTPQKPVVIKQEVQELKIDEDLPKKMVLVEFKSLIMTVPPKTKPKQMQDNSCTKNFKCFRKSRVPGADSIIKGSDLLVHNRGKNSDLDEWLKDAAEEEHQNRRDETVGDDLFRYNPTKLTKRR